MQVIGVRRCEFTAKDGTEVKGYNIFIAYEIISNGKGLQADKFFLSDKKVSDMKLNLDELVGKEIKLSYNKWAKVDGIEIL